MLTVEQEAVCRRFGAEPDVPASSDKLGVALLSETYPLNGLRHPAEHGTCGWYLWRGEEMSDADDFFQPLHVAHVSERYPEAMPYLALPPGWRFIVAPGYEDVWFDPSLLKV